MKNDFDIVIAGGGLVGSALACALDVPGLRLAVIEPQEFPAPRRQGSDPYDLRISAITPLTRRFFEAIHVWPAITAQRVSRVEEMRIWEEGGRSELHFDAADIGEPELAYIVENNVMRAALTEKLSTQHNARVFSNAALQRFDIGTEGVDIELDNGQRFGARLLVGADGAQSLVRQLSGIENPGWRFYQKGIVACVRSALPHGRVARQRFMSTGPIAFLPLSDLHLCSIVWSADMPRADELMAMSDGEFNVALNEAFGAALGHVELVSERAAFELTHAHAEHYCTDRVALVGDAAHRVHPLAGQGVNLGFADAAVLAQVMRDAQRDGRDPGQLRVLRRYERWRRGDNETMLLLMDGLKRLFGNEHPGLHDLRNYGLGITNRLSPVKHKLMRLASGLQGELPDLLRQ